jgi:hypothetical protein
LVVVGGDMQVFICYSRVDKEFAQKLVADLNMYDLRIWMDVRSIPHGANWDKEVQKGLDSSDVLLVLLSPDAVNSQNVADEWSYFIEKNKPIIPLMVRECEVPFRLMRRQRVDFTQGYERGFDQLLRALGSPSATDPDATAKIRVGGNKPVAPIVPVVVPGSAAPKANKPAPSKKTETDDTGAIRTYPVVWSNAYHWFGGLQGDITEGDMMINDREVILIPRTNPLITIPLHSLVRATEEKSIDGYLKLTYTTSDGKTQSVMVMGMPKTRRRIIHAEVIDLLRTITRRPLE